MQDSYGNILVVIFTEAIRNDQTAKPGQFVPSSENLHRRKLNLHFSRYAIARRVTSLIWLNILQGWAIGRVFLSRKTDAVP
jgi:hypothetical protein